MKLSIAAIGLLKSGPEKAMAADYEKRIVTLGRQAGLTGFITQDWSESRGSTAELRKTEETKLLWSALTVDSVAIVLDERGKACSSQEFAKLIESEAQKATRHL